MEFIFKEVFQSKEDDWKILILNYLQNKRLLLEISSLKSSANKVNMILIFFHRKLVCSKAMALVTTSNVDIDFQMTFVSKV